MAALPERDVRSAVEARLEALVQRYGGLVPARELRAVDLAGGERVTLMAQQGIHKPAQLDAALAIRTTYTPPDERPPYEDQEGADGLIRYKYRGGDPQHWQNRALRRCYADRLPLVWLVGVAPAVYLPRFPVWVVHDEPESLQFVLAVDEGQRYDAATDSEDLRAWRRRLTRQRLHQPLFRARVLDAYARQCAVCRLRHPSLLDAAHVIPDSQAEGRAVVPNGLSLCKIHHAAFDQNALGVEPTSLKVKIRPDLLDEIDGPMLRHGFQELHNTQLQVPRAPAAHPARQGLEMRFEQFLSR